MGSNIFKKAVLGLGLVGVLVVSQASSVFAAGPILDSVGTESGGVAGEDITQGKVGLDATLEITDSVVTPDQTVQVYASKAGWVQISIPTVLILGGDTGECSFDIGVAGDIGGAQTVKITPAFAPSSITSTNGKAVPAGGLTAVCTVADKDTIVISAADLLPTAKDDRTKDLKFKGELVVTGLTAGTWSASLAFGVVIVLN